MISISTLARDPRRVTVRQHPKCLLLKSRTETRAFWDSTKSIVAGRIPDSCGLLSEERACRRTKPSGFEADLNRIITSNCPSQPLTHRIVLIQYSYASSSLQNHRYPDCTIRVLLSTAPQQTHLAVSAYLSENRNFISLVI